MTLRAILVGAVIALGCACSNSSAPSSPSGASSGSACKTNADCAAGKVCYFQTSQACGGPDGVCVPRLSTPCSQTLGAGCLCLGVDSASCPGGIGAACQGGDLPAQCWYCHIPQ
jgi:hypothetical protein